MRPSRPPGGQLGEWFGEHDITEGRFFDGLTRLCRNPGGEVAGPLEDLQRAVAALAARGVFGEGPLEELNGAALMAGFTGHGSRIHLGSANLANPGLPVYSFHRKD